MNASERELAIAREYAADLIADEAYNHQRISEIIRDRGDVTAAGMSSAFAELSEEIREVSRG
jgi:hypothetical protein